MVSKGEQSGTSSGGKKQDVQSAMGRLEEAVKELGDAAKGNFADRAAEVLEQTAAKLKSEQSAGSSTDSSTQKSSAWDFSLGANRKADGDGFDGSGTGRLNHWQGARAPRSADGRAPRTIIF